MAGVILFIAISFFKMAISAEDKNTIAYERMKLKRI